jgi:choline dehydrogenase-like flavoprotein
MHDVIIVGSGAGGSAAAYSLVRAGLDVLLIEKGDNLPRDASTLDVRKVVHEGHFRSKELWTDRNGRVIEPEEYFNIGGKTKWYGAALLRYDSREFTADPAHACTAWPIAATDLDAEYAEAEQ